MKVRMLAVTAAVTALTLGTAGTALAAPSGKPKPKPAHSAPAAQITGSKLKVGLLPGSDFASGATTSQESDTGNHLLSPRDPQSVSSMPCTFLGQYSIGNGQTAAAADQFGTPVADTNGVFGDQTIEQFASSSAARPPHGALRRYTYTSSSMNIGV